MTAPRFVDLFSQHSAHYAAARPTYPDALYAWLRAQCASHDRAWDCATGSGQAAVALGEVFRDVIATDASANQLSHAVPHARVRYALAAAENAPMIDDASVDLVAVAEAHHWFERERFYAEVRRVLKPGGVLAIWGYSNFTVSPAIDAVFARYFYPVLAPYWPTEVSSLWRNYADVTLPFEPLVAPPFEIRASWTRAEMLAYVFSWSSAQRAFRELGDAWAQRLDDELSSEWPNEERRVVISPLVVKASSRRSG